MNKLRGKMALALLAGLLPGTAFAADETNAPRSTDGTDMPVINRQTEPPANTPPDNTAVNERDRSAKEFTSDDAGASEEDRVIMQKIRKSVIEDESLSTYGHNVKIIARNGSVLLKGPVNSAEESSNIEAKAQAVAGPANIINQLAVKGSTTP